MDSGSPEASRVAPDLVRRSVAASPPSCLVLLPRRHVRRPAALIPSRRSKIVRDMFRGRPHGYLSPVTDSQPSDPRAPAGVASGLTVGCAPSECLGRAACEHARDPSSQFDCSTGRRQIWSPLAQLTHNPALTSGPRCDLQLASRSSRKAAPRRDADGATGYCRLRPTDRTPPWPNGQPSASFAAAHHSRSRSSSTACRSRHASTSSWSGGLGQRLSHLLMVRPARSDRNARIPARPRVPDPPPPAVWCA